MKIIIFSFFAFITTFSILKKYRGLLIKILPDVPNHRSDHKKTISRGGGIIFFITFAIISFLNGVNSIIFFIPLVLTSLLDDFLNLSNIKRAIIQFITTVIIYYNSNFFSMISNYESTADNLIYLICFSLLGVSIINFCNFMDGIDGILAGNIILILLFCALRFDIFILILVGSLLGFLYWNWEPAKIFMGDTGSTFLGAYLVSILFNLNNSSNFIALILISFPILGDAMICLIIRLINRKNIFKAHKDHLYQRLRKSGWSAKQITSIYMFFTILNIFTFQITGINGLLISSLAAIVAGYFMHKNYASKLFS